MRVWRGERRLPVPVLRAEPGGFMSPALSRAGISGLVASTSLQAPLNNPCCTVA